MPLSRFISLVAALCWSVNALADEPQHVDYLRQIKPVLQSRCCACHGALKQENELRLDTAKSIVVGGESGAAVSPGHAGDSLLIEAVTGDLAVWRMPPEGEPLTPQQISLIRRWIDQGATAPEHEEPQADPRQHWAFQPPVRPAVPHQNPQRQQGKNVDPRSRGGFHLANPIDAFIDAKHREQNLTPAPPAEKHVLLRRVYFDLIGLPPTRDELHAFLADKSPNAYERVVDRLLASPLYGERWARHWMDVWRYADWSGEENNQLRSSPQHIWHWRDWIVESLNADKPYDRMVREMLAGDEIAPDDPDVLRATGFLARNWYKFNRNVWLEDTVEHTAKAFLGLTFNCAKCHDHKYDPITQKNYYQMRAFFEPHDIRTDPLPGQTDTKHDGIVHVVDADSDTPTYLFVRGEEHRPDRDHPLSPGLPDVFQTKLEVVPISLPPRDGESATSTGRRLGLARWIANRDNPLTARVAVNHVWLRHFGAPLVDGMTDFGLRSPRPRFAELLDWLAVEFMNPSQSPLGKGGTQGGWSMKHLHRLIVTSAAYRRASSFADDHQSARDDNIAIDPDNHFFWRLNHRRLEAEAIRDGMLHLAGNLDLTQGGPEIPLEQGETSLRRSIYFRHGLERQVKFLETFDGASVLECYRRTTSIVPQQALALSNSELARRQSRLLARRLSAECVATSHTDESFVRIAFETVLGRMPTDAELSKCVEFLDSEAAPKQARESLAHVLLNHNDFVTVR